MHTSEWKIFLSTPSARRATLLRFRVLKRPKNFYPRPPRGGRHQIAHLDIPAFRFLSTPSARRATSALRLARHAGQFLSTPSARRATVPTILHADWIIISIHALREEGDCSQERRPRLFRHFYPRPPRGGRPMFCYLPAGEEIISIHALREEGDLNPARRAETPTEFLSTPSARRATCAPQSRARCRFYFYPRPPRGGRHGDTSESLQELAISIHALREEGDPSIICSVPKKKNISIHALREEGDGRCRSRRSRRI